MISIDDLIENALASSRPGDAAFLARRYNEQGLVSDDLLLSAARGARNERAFGSCVELCDLLLARDPDHTQALELKSLALIRLDPGNWQKPQELLRRALCLGQGEAAVLQAALHKRVWRHPWFEAQSGWSAPPSEARNRQLAREHCGHLVEAIAAYRTACDDGRPFDYWPAINLATLLAVARHLTLDQRVDALPSPERLERELQALSKTWKPRIEQAAENHRRPEDAYWARVSLAELELVTNVESRDGKAGKRLLEGIGQAVDQHPASPFMVDSTRQQLQMLLALGFRRAAVEPGLDRLQGVWESMVHPEEPASRVVICAPQADVPARDQNYESLLWDLLQELGDTVLLLRGGPTDLELAMAAATLCIPYELYLPCLADEFAGRAVAPQLVPRFWRVYENALRPRGSTSFAAVAGSCLGLDFDYADDEELLAWMLACARAYRPSAARIMRLGKHPHLADMEGMAEVFSTTREPASERAPETVRSHAIRRVTADRCRAPVTGFGATSLPFWVHSLFSQVGKCDDSVLASRWRRYADDREARRLIEGLAVRFEPVQQLTPVPDRGQLMGLSVVGMGRVPNGTLLPYARLREACQGVLAPVDLDLALLSLSLQAIPPMREAMRSAVGRSVDRLFFTLKLSDEVLHCPMVGRLIEEHFNPNLGHAVQFELARPIVERLEAEETTEQSEIAYWKEAVIQLYRLWNLYRCAFVLDVAKPLSPALRELLAPMVRRSTADIQASRGLLTLAESRPERGELVLRRLSGLRQENEPLIIEGVETDFAYQYLKEHWPDDGRITALRGWRVSMPEIMCEHVFEYLDEPRGYTAKPGILGLLGV